MFCTVLTASKSGGIGNGLTYDAGDLDVRPGLLVRVPLRNRLVEAIVVNVQREAPVSEYDLKKVHSIFHPIPLLSEEQIATVRWMAEYYVTTLRQAIGVWLPAPPWIKLLPKKSNFYRAAPKDAALVRGTKQQVMLETLQGREWMGEEDLLRETDSSKATLRGLVTKGFIEEESRETLHRNDRNHTVHLKQLPVLTSAQQTVESTMRQDARPSLLFGVTGSGKTEIYAQLVADAIRAGKQAIVLVPEILLTEHSIHRYQSLLDRDRIAVIHSRLTIAARRALWQRVHRGEIGLVLGSRSALFAPVRKLGAVIIDEEHEWTYKNEQTPRYHAREVAEELCRQFGAKLILGTATPSLEAWARAKEGRYHMDRLPERYKEQALPDVRIVDLAQVNFGTMYPFSPPLLDAIEARLQRGEQSVLFLNRRGIATSILCLQCRRRIVSPESQLPFTVHLSRQGRPYLLDHTSGHIADVPSLCPHCQSPRLLAVGAGTQKVEDLLQRKFPRARILRADADTLAHPDQMRALLATMRERRADILLGTQSVVKGLDLPEVTLAAVILADVGLSLPHFRAGERIFQLLTQLTGRSGRAKQGEVIIQTFRPDAPEIVAASRHETEKYLDQELKLRTYTGYPPAQEMLRLLLREDPGGTRAKRIVMNLQAQIDRRSVRISVKAAPTFFGGGKVWQILLRGERPKELIKLTDIGDAVIDVDPMETV